jgi:type IV pilus assembly protein PilC
MPNYGYKAINAAGQAVEGTFTAGSREDVLAMLRQNRQIPVRVEEIIEGKDVKSLSLFHRVKIKDIAVFCRQFHAMLNAGVTIIICLDTLRQQVENKRLRSAVGELYELVQKGMTLSESMQKHEEIFPELLVNMVAAGEASGNLDTIMERMATHYEKENRINNKVRGAMIYPLMLCGLAVVIIIFLLAFVFPRFISMFQESGVELPLPTLMVMGASSFVSHYWYILAVIIGTAAYFLERFKKSDSGRLLFDSISLRIPLLRTTNQKIVTSRFSRTLSTLLSSGMPLLQCMDVISKIMGNRVVEEGILKAKDELRKGVSLSEPIKKMGFFPPMLISMLRIGEESGSIDEILEKTASYYDDEVEAALESFTKVLEPMMLILVALVVGFIVIAMIMPMFSLMSTVTM